MQSTQASLATTFNVGGNPLSVSKALEEQSESSLPLNKEFIGTYTPNIAAPFANENFSPPLLQKTTQRQKTTLEEDHIKATNCLSAIIDPLWQHICRDVIQMMGVVSFLKIWDSILGEVYLQDQALEIYCKTEETAQFIQQYDFVILGSLQPYFPALKKLRIKTISDL